MQGGIPPYTLSVKPPSTLPGGLVLSSESLSLGGAISSPGNVLFPITVEDDGDPLHSALLSRNVLINPALEFSAPELTGAPLDKAATISLGRTGGTPPFAVADLVGTLPAGLAFDPDTFEVVGTATVAGGERLSVEASDIAGSTATLDTQIVVCVPFGPRKTNAVLAAGDAAAGFYFDAIAQTTANIVVSTLRKNEKRTLQLILIGPDGSEVESGILKLRNGKAILKKIELPRSGRYFAALGSEAGGETTLVGKIKRKQPTSFRGSEKDIGLANNVTVTFPALAGATFTLKGRVTGGLEMRVEYLEAPDGTLLAGGALDVTETKKGIKVNGTADQSGEWSMRLVPKPGNRGNFSYKLKVKNPKNVEFSADE